VGKKEGFAGGIGASETGGADRRGGGADGKVGIFSASCVQVQSR